jgi:hypothetical protein
MAKTSSVEKNNRRIKMAKQYAGKRAKLKAMAVDDKLTPEERFDARLKLPSCRATPRRRASAIAASSRAVRGPSIASSSSRALLCESSRRRALCPAS